VQQFFAFMPDSMFQRTQCYIQETGNAIGFCKNKEILSQQVKTQLKDKNLAIIQLNDFLCMPPA